MRVFFLSQSSHPTFNSFSTERYHQVVEAGVFDEQPVELLTGELFIISLEGLPHAYYSDRASRTLRRLLEVSGLAYVREAKPITLPNASEPQPDIAIVQPLDRVYLKHHPYPENIFWVIEYAQSSLPKDLEIKSRTYAEANIGEYWVINLRNQQLIVFSAPKGREYRSKVTLTNGEIAPKAFPELMIEVRQLIN